MSLINPANVTTLVTLVVGLFGFVLYMLRNSDAKRRTARIILLEITNAEMQLRDAKNRLDESEKSNSKRVPEHLYVMPLDSWTSNRHLFVNDFKSNEWAAINEFYDKCQLFDEAVKLNDSRFAKDEQLVRESVHKATYDLAYEMVKDLGTDSTDEEVSDAKKAFFNKRDALANFLTTGENLWLYTPSKGVSDIEYILTNVDMNLSISSVGTKLTRLSAKRFNFRKLNKQ